jgi:hypothetical protein
MGALGAMMVLFGAKEYIASLGYFIVCGLAAIAWSLSDE